MIKKIKRGTKENVDEVIKYCAINNCVLFSVILFGFSELAVVDMRTLLRRYSHYILAGNSSHQPPDSKPSVLSFYYRSRLIWIWMLNLHRMNQYSLQICRCHYWKNVTQYLVWVLRIATHAQCPHFCLRPGIRCYCYRIVLGSHLLHSHLHCLRIAIR